MKTKKLRLRESADEDMEDLEVNIEGTEECYIQNNSQETIVIQLMMKKLKKI